MLTCWQVVHAHGFPLAMNDTEYLRQIGVFAFCCTDRGFPRFTSRGLFERLDDSQEVGLRPPQTPPAGALCL